jgi:DNA-binding transcriptional LysR family regulator
MAMHFDLVDMRLFIHIAETNSITRGAERACISLPAASTRIKRFEDNLGLKLFYRTSHGITLTPPGQVLLQHSRSIHQQLEQLRGDLQEYAQGLKGTLRILANTTAMAEFIPALLPTFLADHPDVNVDLRERLSPDIVRAVSEGSTDIGIVAGHIRTEGLEVLPYRIDRLVVVTSPKHPLGKFDKVNFFNTLEYDQVCLSEASAISSFLSQVASEHNKALLTRIRVGNFEAACRIIEANVAIGILPESAAKRHAKNMDIKILHLTDEWSLRKLCICVRSLALLPSFARELINLMIKDVPESERSNDSQPA